MNEVMKTLWCLNIPVQGFFLTIMSSLHTQCYVSCLLLRGACKLELYRYFRRTTIVNNYQYFDVAFPYLVIDLLETN